MRRSTILILVLGSFLGQVFGQKSIYIHKKTGIDQVHISGIDEIVFPGYNVLEVRGNQEDEITLIDIDSITFSAPAGLYIGVIGFNDTTTELELGGPLYRQSKPSYTGFIDSLDHDNNTILYHAVDLALDRFQESDLPEDLSNVSLITFTDGLDQGSWMLHRDEYENESAMLSAVHDRIMSETVYGKPVSAYSVGIMGPDVTNTELFTGNLSQLASNSENVFEVNDMSEVYTIFGDLAHSLNQTNVSYKQTVQITVPGKSSGTKIRFTFDHISDAGNSSLFIEGEFSYQGNYILLTDLSYEGLTASSGSSVMGSVSGVNVTFTFGNVVTENGSPVRSSDIDQWEYISGTSWQKNSEFDPSQDTRIETDTIHRSAAIILVLDCSSSLGDKFYDMQSAATNFINILLDVAEDRPIYLCEVSTMPITNISRFTAESGGIIESNGGANVTARGVCWATSNNPTLSDNYTVDDSGNDRFSSLMTGLKSNTTYYVSAYATNQVGTRYGQELEFKTRSQETGEIAFAGVSWVAWQDEPDYEGVTGYADNPYETPFVDVLQAPESWTYEEITDAAGFDATWEMLGDAMYISKIIRDPANGDPYDLDENGDGTFGASWKGLHDGTNLYILMKYIDTDNQLDEGSHNFEVMVQPTSPFRHENTFAAASDSAAEHLVTYQNMAYARVVELGGGKAVFQNGVVSEYAASLGLEKSLGMYGYRSASWGANEHGMEGLATATHFWDVTGGVIRGIMVMSFDGALGYPADPKDLKGDYTAVEVGDTISFDIKSRGTIDENPVEYQWSSDRNTSYASNYYSGRIILSDE
jgi:hypothetical protein